MTTLSTTIDHATNREAAPALVNTVATIDCQEDKEEEEEEEDRTAR